MSDTQRSMLMTILEEAHRLRATDLILAAGAPPSVYIDNRLQPMSYPVMTAGALEELLRQGMNKSQAGNLENCGDVDFAMSLPNLARCRFNVHRQRNSLAAAIRFVSSDIPSLPELHLPPILTQFAEYPRGMVLVAGGTGSGKSTTLAAMLNHVNQNMAKHVITLEDPIEYTFRHGRSIIEQREIGQDSSTFISALRHVVRQKPDIILVGEMRDLETISTALTAAETGHLVLASLHTCSATQTIDRIVDVFDSGRQGQIRLQLAQNLRAIVCQILLVNEVEGGLVPALEILVNNFAVSRAIRDRDTHLIPGIIETGAKQGMQLLDQAIARLVSAGMVSQEAALAKCGDPERLRRCIQAAPLSPAMGVRCASAV